MKNPKSIIFLFVTMLSCCAKAPGERPYPFQFSSIGGLETCPAFGGAPENEAWVAGYWSGRNRETGATVGMNFTATQIVERIKALCSTNPSLNLLSASERVYDQMRQEPRPNIQ